MCAGLYGHPVYHMNCMSKTLRHTLVSISPKWKVQCRCCRPPV